MKIVYYFSYLLAAVVMVGETARRGFSYFSVNATTMVEDYLGGALLLAAALLWRKGRPNARQWMIAAWAYVTGAMFVPFFAHLEAWLRGATFRPDHLHTDIDAIFIKGVIWTICLACFVVSLGARQSAVRLARRSAPV